MRTTRKLLEWLLCILPPLNLPAAEDDGDTTPDDDAGADDNSAKGGDGDDNDHSAQKDAGQTDSGKDEKTAAELERLAKENTRLQEEVRKAKADARKRDQDKRTKKALEEGKLQEELTKTTDDLAAAQEKADKLEAAAKARIARQVAKLPKEAQEEIDLVKDDLPFDKLEALVEKRTAAAVAAAAIDGVKAKDKDKSGDHGKTEGGGKPPPTIGVHGIDATRDMGHEIHPETKGVMKALYAREQQFDTARALGISSDNKFGWGRSDDEQQSTANFIHLLDSIKAQPIGGPDEDALAARVFKRK